jgi:hypothetical protein
MSKVPPAVSAYMAKIGAKGGRSGKGVKKREAAILGGRASGEARRRKALDKRTKPV